MNYFAGRIEYPLTVFLDGGASLRIQAASVKLHHVIGEAGVMSDDFAFHQRVRAFFDAARMHQDIGQLQIHGRGKRR